MRLQRPHSRAKVGGIRVRNDAKYEWEMTQIQHGCVIHVIQIWGTFNRTISFRQGLDQIKMTTIEGCLHSSLSYSTTHSRPAPLSIETNTPVVLQNIMINSKKIICYIRATGIPIPVHCQNRLFSLGGVALTRAGNVNTRNEVPVLISPNPSNY